MDAFPFLDVAFARRIEAFNAADFAAYALAARDAGVFPDAVTMPVAGGIAVYVGQAGTINCALGLGMTGPVGGGDIDAIVEFFESRGCIPSVDVCPMADPFLLVCLASRGFQPIAFENVLVRPLSAEDTFPKPAPDVTVRRCTDEDSARVWGDVTALSFTAPRRPTAEERRLADGLVGRRGAVLLLGEVDGQAAGTGQLTMADGIAMLNADGTLPEFRRRGVQQALQAERLRIAAEAGCTLATIEAAPGSASQRNMERIGFRVAYTRVSFEKRSGSV